MSFWLNRPSVMFPDGVAESEAIQDQTKVKLYTDYLPVGVVYAQ
jgi:hypothetical protein